MSMKKMNSTLNYLKKKIHNLKKQFLNLIKRFRVHREVEKMSKSKYNVVNPDEICEKFGTDTLRMYEMFLRSTRTIKAMEYCWNFWSP